MSAFYSAKRNRNLFAKGHGEPFRISRSKIELFMNCPRCFYMDLRLGVSQPPGYPFSLNNAVDKLLKKEFDIHRAQNTRHPLMEHYGVDAVPFDHPDMAKWRDARTAGIAYLHEPTNLLITGGVDDVWVDPTGELMIVDYKATSKSSEVSLDADWQIGYKRQMEVYQWLFRRNGFRVSNIGYFVYCNGNADREAFDARLEFDIKIIPYTGDDGWVEEAIHNMNQRLLGDTFPPAGSACDFCDYRKAVRDAIDGLEVA